MEIRFGPQQVEGQKIVDFTLLKAIRFGLQQVVDQRIIDFTSLMGKPFGLPLRVEVKTNVWLLQKADVWGELVC